jgi:biopolymer transport protein ExbB
MIQQRSSRSKLAPRGISPAFLALLLVAGVWMMSRNVFAADATAQQPNQDTPAQPEKLSALDLALKGGIVMYPLALSSILAIGIILERFLALRRAKVMPAGFLAGVKGVLRNPERDRDAALAYCQSNPSPLSRIIAAGIRHLPRGWVAAEKAMEDAGATECIRLRQNMRLLYALGSTATLLGLIGTISGMIRAFQVAAVAGVGRVDQLSKGIYEAMVCTFAGLAVAIAVTPFYYYFVGRIERLVADLNETLTRFGDDYALPGSHPAPAPATESVSPSDVAPLPATPAVA